MTDYNDIPDFLKLTAEQRRKAWEGKTLSDARGGSYELPPLEQARREDAIAKRKEKNARGLSRLQALHAGEYYDRRRKQWLPRKAK